MQGSSDSSQLVYAHDEHWWHCSLTCSQSSQIRWVDDNWDGHFPFRSGPILPPLISHPRSLHHVSWDIHQVCVSSNRISLHSCMCLSIMALHYLADRLVTSFRPSFSPFQQLYHASRSMGIRQRVPGSLQPSGSYSGCMWRSPSQPQFSVRLLLRLSSLFGTEVEL